MRTRFLIALGIGSALALGGAALAQQPAPAPAPAPAAPAAPPEYGPPITNEQAKAVAAAALAEAKKNNWRMAFSIVGPAGELVYFERMDGTQMASAELAHSKARTAAFYRRPTKIFADQWAAGNTAFIFDKMCSRPTRACSSALRMMAVVSPPTLMSSWNAVMPAEVPVTLKSMSPR